MSRVDWMPQEADLSASLMIRPDDRDPANGPAAAPGSGASTLSLETRRVYAGAWQAFLAWHGGQSWSLILPVPPERVVAYIESLPPSLGPNGIKLRMAAIAEHHEERRLASPTAHAAVRAALRRRQTAREAVLARLASCGEDLAGLRNRALLLLIQVGGLTPAEGAWLDREDLRFEEEKLVLAVRPADALVEQQGQAVELRRRRGDPICPTQALERWLQRSGISYGPVFRAITVHGTLERRLGGVGVRRILRQIDSQAAAQVMPEGRKPVRGAWRKMKKGRSVTRVHSSSALAKKPSIKTPRRSR